MAAIISAQNLVKTYGAGAARKRAVDGFSFEVNAGEIFALIGPNGAGKSTTLRMVLNLIQPDSGELRVFGGAMNPRHWGAIGYMPEERGLYKNVALLPMLTYLGQLKGMGRSAAQNRARALLEELDLGAYAKKRLGALSKGMAQKVQFIATILHHPRLVIIDEPFSGLDPLNTQTLKDLLYQAVQQDGAAVVMSTHQMAQLQEMAGRMAMIARGRRVLYGEVDAVRRSYAENAVIIQGEGAWETLAGVRSVEARKNRDEVLLRLTPDTSPQTLMGRISAAGYVVRRFELAIPSLEEIFIRVAGETQA
jgi:ABC-2 type transport system ATP-binding protein